MAASTFLLQGQENTKFLLSFFHVDEDGFLVDAAVVEFRIVDSASSEVVAWTSVASGDGKFDTGSYYAHDGSSPISIGGAAAPGTWRIYWRWKAEATDDYSTWSMPFEVVSSSFPVSFSYRTVISPTQVRDEGVSTSTLSDARLAMLLDRVQTFLEARTEVYFRPIPLTLSVNGLHSEAMFFGVPIVGVEWVKANGSTTQLSSTSFAVNNARADLEHRFQPAPDPRRNPYIRFRADTSIYSSIGGLNRSNPRFTAGAKLQKIKGVFGFLESDGLVPPLITYAALKLIYANTTALTTSSTTTAGPIVSETVDRHTVSYATTTASTGTVALASSPEVEEIIAMYRRPITLGTTAPTWPLPLDTRSQ